MADRHTLAVNHLEAFKGWLISEGWQIHNIKGFYEVLRASKDGRKHPLIVYRRNGTNNGKEPVHYTVMDRDYGVVRAYLRNMKIERKQTRKD